MQRTVVIGMADMAVVRPGRGEEVLLKTTLGSCVGVLLRDRGRGVYGLAHVMLPERPRDDGVLGKYADTAIALLLERMGEQGANRLALEACLVGGACMFQSDTVTTMLTIGTRNLEAVRRVLRALQIPITEEDTGGNQGRTLVVDCRTAEISVRTLQKLDSAAGESSNG